MAAPTVPTPIADQSHAAGQQIFWELAAAFLDNDITDSLTYTMTGEPAGTGLSINPTTGVISGAPTQADIDAAPYTITITATDESLNYVDFQLTLNPTAGGGAAQYTDNTETPHTTTNATVYRTLAQVEAGVNVLDGNSAVKKFTSGISNSPDDFIYTFVGDGTTSLVVDLSGDLGHVCKHPMRFDNWKDVKLIGVYFDFDILSQNYSWPTFEYPYPKVPGGMVVRVDIVEKFWCEGCWIKMDSGSEPLNADYFVWRGTHMNAASPYTDYSNSSFIVQNCKFEGLEGASCYDPTNSTTCAATDTMYHNDLWQNQSQGDAVGRPKKMVWENVVARAGEQGITWHGWSQGTGGTTPTLKLRNFDMSINGDNANAYDRGNGIAVVASFIFTQADVGNNLTLSNVTWNRVFDYEPFMRYDTDRYLVDPADSAPSKYDGNANISRATYAPGLITNAHVESQYLGGNYISDHAHDHY